MSKLQLDYDTPRANVEIEAEYTFSVISELQDGSSSLSIKITIASIRVISAHDEDDNKLTDQEVERIMFKHRKDIMKEVEMQILEGVIK